MKPFLIFFLLIGWGSPALAQPELTPERLREFQELTQQRVEDFQDYLAAIGDKNRSMAERLKAIDLANGLFEVGAMMQVSGRDGQKRTLPVKQYFKNLLDLPYSKVEITYYKPSVATEFEKGPDGNYHAIATYFQEFKGKDSTGKTVYNDKVRKNIQVTGKGMDAYKAAGEQALKIFFGDITISETQPIPMH